jgi:hypothetical protein
MRELKLCGLRNTNGTETFLWLPVNKANLGAAIILKEKGTQKEESWSIFGVCHSVLIEKDNI